jgi:hypothetical protein
MRGTRFRRRTTKKQSTRERKEERENSVYYQEQAPIDPSQVSARILNALEHLGSQRFALPPFSEHFERWIKDVRAILVEMETDLPGMADQPYMGNSERILSDLQLALHRRIDAEKENSEEVSKLHQELTSCELELSKLEHDYKARSHEAKRGHERSLEKIKGEIDSLDKQRLNLLRKRPSIVDRLFHRPRTKLEESMRVLQTKRTDIGSKQRTLKEDLDKLRADYETSRKQLIERQGALKVKLTEFKTNTPNDALDVRNQACKELGRTVVEAMGRLPAPEVASKAENIQ